LRSIGVTHLELTYALLLWQIVTLRLRAIDLIKEEQMFDIHQSAFDEDGDWDEGLIEDYCDGVMEAFAESPEGIACAEHFGEIGWVHTILHYGLTYLGNAPPEMSKRDVDEILFSIIPRKVSTEPESATEMIGEFRAFWEFLDREYQLADAPSMITYLDAKAERRLKQELSNPKNFGMAKSIFSLGAQAGFDMTTQEGLDQFMLAYNRSLMSSRQGIGPTANEMTSRQGSGSSANDQYVPPPTSSTPKTATVAVKLTTDERKAREKLRRKKLGKSKRKRR
jgi:hypothetical protein